MTRRRALLVALTAGAGLLALVATVGGTEHAGVDALLRGIDDAAAAATAAQRLADAPWVSRVTGLGVGAAFGLAGGGVLGYAYYRRKL